MIESDYWLSLEWRLCDEMSGVPECRRAGLWCDGLYPDLAQVDPLCIHGEAWIGIGPRRQHLWRFTLVLPPALAGKQPIEWSALLPADDVTGWLSMDFDAQRLEIDPAAAIPDAEVPAVLAARAGP